MNESVRNAAIGTRAMLISKRWVQAVAIVMLFGFFVLGLLAYRTYTDQAPIPGKVVRPDGQVLFTGTDIIAGQKIFLRNGLMEYGSIFGHGAYLGPDFTVQQLVRQRAPAHTCNARARKNNCTDSEHGREIIHSSESWIVTEVGKFYRGLSLTLLLLAALILVAEMFVHPTLPQVLLLGPVLALVLTRGLYLTRERWLRGPFARS